MVTMDLRLQKKDAGAEFVSFATAKVHRTRSIQHLLTAACNIV